MKAKITLITPPDFFENENISLLFIHLQDQDQLKVSEWFGRSDIDKNINVYFYNDEPATEWLLHAVNRCDMKLIDLDHTNKITSILAGHLLAKTNFYYKTEDETTSQICQHLNNNKITNIEDFLEKAFNGKARSET
ncbi:MAG: hypothetical protein EBU90_07810 [Proteobacteria bacterium]|nr:hypothetical protein [Pseudomonadota bacterium]NBP14104.1 hypothetical protein [bacterium]